MNAAILFPGQGAQFPGMGRDWCEAFPVARRTFEEADAILDFPLSEACWAQGDNGAKGDGVHRTDIAQPGILTTSVAVVRVLEERGLDRSSIPFTAGLSLGEYSALWCAGSLSFEDALRLVRLRGQAMQAASEALPSSMTSLMGATPEQADALAAVGAEHGICSVANLNSPGQVVISGELSALEAAEAAAKGLGVRRTRRLVVAGGFHSECMRPAAERLSAALADVQLNAPAVPFANNVTGAGVEDPETIRRNLADQVCAPVHWEACVRWALERGITEFLEPAPGTVLAGILRKIDGDAVVRSAARPNDVEEAAGT